MTIVIDQRVVRISLLVAALAGLAWLGWTRLSPGRTVIGAEQLTALDPDNAGINIVVTQPWMCDTAVVFDVRRPDEREFNRMDVTRCLMQCAQALKDKPLARVYLANNGQRLYYIKGSEFKQIGEQYGRDSSWDNAMLATRIPMATYTLNDSLAFAPHGGMLATIDNAEDWNTIMSQLLKTNDPSWADRIFYLWKMF